MTMTDKQHRCFVRGISLLSIVVSLIAIKISIDNEEQFERDVREIEAKYQHLERK